MSATKDHKGNVSKKRRSKIVKIVLALILFSILAAGLAFASAIIICIKDLPPFDPDKLQFVEASFVYDNQGQEITALHDEQNRVIVSLDEIPEHVQKAFIAIEDERFEKHFGVDIIGFFRALLTNIRYRSIQQGFSTITQQLARNTYLTFDQTYERKIKEVWLALLIEKHFSKEDILEMYLNRIYFGNRAYGVEAAAQTYFGKHVSDLSIAEGALIAGIISSPNINNPFNSEEIAASKQLLVLKNMLRLKYIDQAQYDQALAEGLLYGEPPVVEYPHPYFIDYVVHRELVDILTGIPQFGSEDEAYYAIYNGGLRIYTTMDSSYQAEVEDVLNRSDLYPRTVYVDMTKLHEAIQTLPSDPEISLSGDKLSECIDEEKGVPQPQAAVVLANPQTGEITALGGGREYSKNNQLLRFTSLRQPGSAIKPLVTYAPAFEEGILAGAGSVLDDSPYISGSWAPENFDYRFRGLISVREALLYSFNIPAVRAFEMLTPQVGTRYAEKMGISTFAPGDEQYLPTTLGGITNGVTALDMAQAYCVLANEGLKLDLHAITRIENRRGQVIYQYSPKPQQILSPQTTFLVTDILQDLVRYYTGRNLNIDRPVACKTGTTNYWRDVYLAAYTPNLVATFWMGYDEPRVGNIEQGWSYSTTFLREIFKGVFKTLPIENFKRPPGIAQAEICTKSGLLATDLCRAQGTVTTDYFLESHVPRLSCDRHVAVDIDTTTGLPAGPFVPPYLIETKIILNRPPYLVTDSRWSGKPGRRPEDADQMLPTGELDDPVFNGERPETPSGFKATVQDNLVLLEWRYPHSHDIKSFMLFRQKKGEERQFIAYIHPEYLDYTDFLFDSPGSEYTYTLYATDRQDRYSVPVELKLHLGGDEDPLRPQRPTDFQGAFLEGGVALTWTDPGITPDSFILERKKPPGNYEAVATLPGNRLTYQDTDLEAGSTYYYRLYALKNGITSQPADFQIFVPPREGEYDQPGEGD